MKTGNNKITQSEKATEDLSSKLTGLKELMFKPGGSIDKIIFSSLSKALEELETGGLDSVNSIAKNWIKNNTEVGASIEQVTEAIEKETEALITIINN